MSQLFWARTCGWGHVHRHLLQPSQPLVSATLDGRSAVSAGSTFPPLIGWSACLFVSGGTASLRCWCSEGQVSSRCPCGWDLIGDFPASAKMPASLPPSLPHTLGVLRLHFLSSYLKAKHIQAQCLNVVLRAFCARLRGCC